jgi:polyisoprenoid-binding protein YceI
MRTVKVIIVLTLMSITCEAQKYAAEKSEITFFSEAPMENIHARNKKSVALLDLSSGQLVFSAPVNAFQFEKGLMEEHFNEKYMETHKYPKSTFQGSIMNFNPGKTGVQQVTAKGKLDLHGVTKEIEVPGTAEITSDKKIVIKTSFNVRLKDYNISIPQLLWQNIAEQVEVKLDFTFKPKT